MSAPDLFVEIESSQRAKSGEDICGDTFRSTRVAGENRIISVLSDGLGKGVKANILSTMTATMALRFIASDSDIVRSAETIMDALPTCQVRKISYATFTIIDNQSERGVRIIEMDNPPFLLIRNGRQVVVPYGETASPRWKERTMRIYHFTPQPQDRIIVLSDGITQAGLGSDQLKLGWRLEGCRDFILEQVRQSPGISARDLAECIVRKALRNEVHHKAEDDMTAAVIYFRRPRRLLLLTGPPFDGHRDAEFAEALRHFDGRRIVCGGTTADIVARQLGREVTTDLGTCDMDTPPIATMKGVDLVTEGILTLTRTAQLLESDKWPKKENAATRLAGLLRSSDSIEFLVGTRVNEAHQDPSHPEDLEIRRNIIKRIARTLEEKHLKEVQIRYI